MQRISLIENRKREPHGFLIPCSSLFVFSSAISLFSHLSAYTVSKRKWETEDVGQTANINVGLSEKDVLEARQNYGKNTLTKKKKEGFIKKLLHNLGDPVIKILLGALVINLIFMFKSQNYVECIGIGVSVLIATLISTLSECGSERAFSQLEAEGQNGKVRALRDGDVALIDTQDVVVGDILLISAGEGIAADGEVVFGEVFVDSSSMTGESREVRKRERRQSDNNDTTPASPYYLHRGSLVMSGEGKMRVTAVGDNTFLGGISSEIQEEKRESPLKMRLSKLAGQISRIGYIAAFVIAFIYLFNIFVIDSRFDTEIMRYKLTDISFVLSSLFGALTLGLTVIVVAVPEGLPMMIAVVLSSNVKKMIKDNVLVKKPVGIESAGSMNILFFDKTGTLTSGKMSVGEIYSGDGQRFDDIRRLEKCGGKIFDSYLCGAYINTQSAVGVDSDGKRCVVGGNSSERALLLAAMQSKKKKPLFSMMEKLEFDSSRKFSAAKSRIEGREILMIKGAPDVLMPHILHCMTVDGARVAADKKKIGDIYKSLADKGKRVILTAEADGKYASLDRLRRGVIPSLTLVSLVVLEDKIRSEAKTSVATLHGAGIQTVMITGDNLDTAKSIAESCKIIEDESHIALTSGQMAKMSDFELKNALPSLRVVARALPSDKSRLVRLASELGLVVGMTGDGINDAPALRAADVGFSMGSGTQVAREAGDIVILDDNLSSIVRAVHFGRNIFKSIRKFITLQLLMNFSAVGVSVICPFLGIDSPVTVVQMLWINIIMDTLGGLAFAGEAPLLSDMKEAPKKREEPILNGYMVNEILVQGMFTVALCITFLKTASIVSKFRYAPDNIYLLSAFFALFIFASVFNCFGCRTDRLKLFSGLSKNRGFTLIMSAVLVIQIAFIYLGGQVLRTVPLTARELILTLCISAAVIPAEMIRKALWRIFFGKRGY